MLHAGGLGLTIVRPTLLVFGYTPCSHTFGSTPMSTVFRTNTAYSRWNGEGKGEGMGDCICACTHQYNPSRLHHISTYAVFPLSALATPHWCDIWTFVFVEGVGGMRAEQGLTHLSNEYYYFRPRTQTYRQKVPEIRAHRARSLYQFSVSPSLGRRKH